ncbi:hypothetical protein BHE74_00029595 [Ensete ventricosum]|nr:hypothetical protein BHE74_00029595 [Ensete ventricosum]
MGKWASCPQAAPLWAQPLYGLAVGTAPLRASRGHCPCGLAVGKRHPLQAGHEWVLPLQPGYGRALPLQPGCWQPGATTSGRCPYGLATSERRPLWDGHERSPLLVALAACGCPCKG